MEEYKPTKPDAILAIIFLFALPLTVIIYGAINFKMWLVGIPYIVYGLYGLSTNRIWFLTRINPQNGKRFKTGDNARKISLMYIALGTILSLLFYWIFNKITRMLPENMA